MKIKHAFNKLEPRNPKGEWTKGETRAWLARHPIDPKNIVDMYHQATEDEKTTGRVWYPKSHALAQALAKRDHTSVREAAGLLAAYSPQTAVGKNYTESSEVERTGIPIGGPGAHMSIVRTPKDLQEHRVGVMAPTVTAKRAAAILAGTDFEDAFAGPRNKSGKLPPASLKIRAFGELIANGKQPDPEHPRVVIDRHAAGVARGVRMTDDDYNIANPSGSLKKFSEYSNAYLAAARTLSKELGREVTPEEVQATTWLTRRRLNGELDSAVGATQKKLGRQDVRNAMNYFASYDPDAAEDMESILGLKAIQDAGLARLHDGKYTLVDLAHHYDPNQLRDPATGRWTKNPGSAVHKAERAAMKAESGARVKLKASEPAGGMTARVRSDTDKIANPREHDKVSGSNLLGESFEAVYHGDNWDVTFNVGAGDKERKGKMEPGMFKDSVVGGLLNLDSGPVNQADLDRAEFPNGKHPEEWKKNAPEMPAGWSKVDPDTAYPNSPLMARDLWKRGPDDMQLYQGPHGHVVQIDRPSNAHPFGWATGTRIYEDPKRQAGFLKDADAALKAAGQDKVINEKPVSIHVPGSWDEPSSVKGYVRPIMADDVWINPEVMDTAGRERPTDKLRGKSWFAPAYQNDDVTSAQYVMTHELGHIRDARHKDVDEGPAGPAAQFEVKAMPGEYLSQYARTNTYEAYAEQFANWALKGQDKSTKMYAEHYGWGKP